MLGMTTVRMFDRAFARGIGTILGALLLSGILYFHPHTMIAVILMGAAAAMTEAFVGANYAFAVIFITTQVILLNGLASGNLSMEIAYTRILDVIIGITIAIVGILILNRKRHHLCCLMQLQKLYVKKLAYFIIYFQQTIMTTMRIHVQKVWIYRLKCRI